MRVCLIVRAVLRAIADMNRAQRRLAVLNAAADRHLLDSNAGPESYPEFLFRTSGPLVHEPTASERGRGRLVR